MVSLDNLNPQYVTDAAGNKKSVILPISTYNNLLRDLQDLAIVAERRDEDAVSHQSVIEGLKKDGLV